jgi:uncharacterized protein (TIGR03067 family)
MSARIHLRWAAIGFLAFLAPTACAADGAAVDRAIARGVDYLKQSQTKEGLWPRQAKGTMGATALAGLALLECGVSADDPTIRKAAAALREGAIPLTDTYSIALCILFSDRLADTGDVPLIESLTVRLLAGQTADGGWTYECPSIGEAEVRRLNDLTKDRGTSDRKQQTAEKRRTAKDLPLPIQQQLLLVEQLKPGTVAVWASDNSNTQFATLALWVGHRYGPPVNKALSRLEARYRATQNADGGWGYGGGGPPPASTPAMTCAGLLGLAVADGIGNEASLVRNKENKQSPDDSAKAAKDSARPLKEKPRTPRDPARDRSIRAGLRALGTVVGQPIDPRQEQTGTAGIAHGSSPSSFLNYYFLWSLERVAMVFGLDTIGKKDWYGWGADFALAQQRSDGSWNGGYAEGGVDTSFALLFLCRSNLAQDLATSLRGKVQDPGEVALRAGGGGGGELTKKDPRPLPGPAKNGEDAKAGSDLDPKLLPPDPFAPRDNRTEKGGSPPLLKGTAPFFGTATDPEVARLSALLVQAPPLERDALLEKFKSGKGVVHTQALALAIPQLTGTTKTKARDALAERMARMTASTLVDKLQDTELEIRRAAALACAMKEEKKLIPNLIGLLEDPERPVVRAAHVALKALTGQDFGPEADASRAERATAIAAWKSWWTKQKDSLVTDRPPGDDSLRDPSLVFREKLQGTWVLTGLEQQGTSVPKAQLGRLRITLIFRGDKVTFEYPDHREAGTFALDATEDPKTIDVVTELNTSKGIIRLEGDILTICGVPAEEERPAEFTTKPGTKQVLFVLKRQKP